MIDLDREKPVTLSEACRLVPAVNAMPGMAARRPLHPRTLYNWTTRGKRGVTLEVIPVGGILVTTKEALQRFFARLAQARDQRFYEKQHTNHGQPRRRRSTRSSERAHADALRRLAENHGV